MMKNASTVFAALVLLTQLTAPAVFACGGDKACDGKGCDTPAKGAQKTHKSKKTSAPEATAPGNGGEAAKPAEQKDASKPAEGSSK